MLYIRTDMNETIATGHVMRCISIALACRKLGEECTFILSDNNAVDTIVTYGFRTEIITGQYNNPDYEIDELKRFCIDNNVTKLLIDNYYVTEKYLRELRSVTYIAYIDDLNLFDYPVDMLIAYTPGYERFEYSEMKDRRLVLGIDKTPLRPAFYNCPKKTIAGLSSVLLLSGGGNVYNTHVKIIPILRRYNIDSIHVICGRFDTHYEEVLEKFSKCTNVFVHHNVEHIENYMKDADLAITAGGTTTLELCAMGVPMITYTVAENQVAGAEALARKGLVYYVGDARDSQFIHNVEKKINEIYCKQAQLTEMATQLQSIVDGKGAITIAEELSKI